MNDLREKLGHQFGAAADDKNAEKLLDLSQQCQSKIVNANATEKAILRFYEANCYSTIANIKSADLDYLYSWNADERVLGVLALRQAVSETSFNELDHIIQCKILTNLGSILSQLGRPIEAIKNLDKSLKIIPNLAVTLGNKGKCLIYYGQSLYDYGHTRILIAYAKEQFDKALSEDALWDSGSHPEASDEFAHCHSHSIKYLGNIKYDFEFDLNQRSLGHSVDETNYRRWCLHHHLFLSPLNDAMRLPVAAQDVIHLPAHTYKTTGTTRFPNYYNLLKQEYVTARYMLYEAMMGDDKHISDNGVLLLDGFDGVQFGYRTEQLKTAYRLGYSLFDKIALFINDYFSVGLDARDVNFRNIWWDKRKANGTELHPRFSESKNWPLKGLYYLFKDVSLPDSQELANLRNRIEHRFLSLQDYPATVQNTGTHSYITIADFEDKTLRILSMAREALIYLPLAIDREAALRRQQVIYHYFSRSR